MNDFDFERLVRSPWVIGAVGSVIAAWKALGSSVPERIFNALAGTAVAGIGAPALCEVAGLTSPNVLAVAALVLGLVGMSLAEQLIRAGKESQLGQFINAWVKRFSPKE